MQLTQKNQMVGIKWGWRIVLTKLDHKMDREGGFAHSHNSFPFFSQ